MKVLTTPQEIRDAAKGKGIAPEALEALIEAAFGPTTTAPELEAAARPLKRKKRKKSRYNEYGILKHRKINGVIFYLVATRRTKQEARAEASRLRKPGWRLRVFHVPTGTMGNQWAVYDDYKGNVK